MTVPQIFIGDRHIGGCDDLFALERAGRLDELFGA
jgi:glutaredoxin 3